MKRKYSIAIIVLITLIIFVTAELDFNPSVKILASVLYFSESTLNDPGYLAHGIDLKDLFRNYSNADVEYSGSAYIKKIKDFPYSISGSINGQRSTSQRKFSCKSDLNVFVLDVGKVDLYADDDTVYLVTPMLGDTSYGFDTNQDLFLQAPNLNNDINRQWFHENKKNILDFVGKIQIKKTDNVFVDEDGKEAFEYRIVIPKGEGKFIWELLGMTPPDHDINTSIFLDKLCRTRKVVFDLSSQRKGAYLSICGKNLGKLELYSPLPDNEDVLVTIQRNRDYKYTNSFTNNVTYNTSGGDKYTLDCGALLNYSDEGINVELTNIGIAQNNTTLAQAYIKAKLAPVKDMGDVFENAHADLSGATIVNWSTIKNDTAQFVDDVISKARENINLVN